VASGTLVRSVHFHDPNDNIWSQKLVVDSDTRQLVNDGPEFLRHFEDAIAAKALFAHLAWDLTPKSSAIYRVYSVNSANEIATFPRISSDWTSISSGAEYHPRAITSVAFSPDGNRVVSGSQGGLLQLWDASTGDPVRDALVGHSAAVRTLAFSPDGNRIVSGSTDATLRLCDAMSWTLIGKPLRGHAAAVQSVTFSPDGTQVVSGSFDGMVRLWETETGRPIGNPFTGHAGPVLSVSYSPLGNMVGSGGWDTTVRVWDVETGTTIGPTLPCHASTVDSVVYSPEGAQLASGSSDGMVHFCNAETGTPLDKMCIHGARFGSPAAFSRDRVLPPFRLVLSETGWVILSTAARDLKMTWVPQLRRGGVQAFTNDGRLCIGLRDGQLMMVDARNVLTESLRNTVGTIDLWGDQLTDPFPVRMPISIILYARSSQFRVSGM
jgi:WD40 repeat protein